MPLLHETTCSPIPEHPGTAAGEAVVVQAGDSAQRSARLQALGRLASGAAHEFNNVLGVVSNSAHLLKGEVQPLGPHALQRVEAIQRAVDSGSRVTRRLQRFAGAQPSGPELIELGAYLEDLQDLLRTAVGKRIRLNLRVEPGTPPVHADAAELELALINLGLDARDAIEGAGEIELHARRATAQDGPGRASDACVLLRFSASTPGGGTRVSLLLPAGTCATG